MTATEDSSAAVAGSTQASPQDVAPPGAAYPATDNKRTQQLRDALSMLFGFRLLNALCLRTFFQPDEYYQALEPAWQIAFGLDSGPWMTWVGFWRRSLCREISSTANSCSGVAILPALIPSSRPFLAGLHSYCELHVFNALVSSLHSYCFGGSPQGHASRHRSPDRLVCVETGREVVWWK